MDNLYNSRMHVVSNMTSAGPETMTLTEENILSLLVVLGSSVSLVALVFAFITYSLFSDIRNLFGTTLMNLLAALFMCQLLYVVGVGGVNDSELCIALALALQYARLCVFCWLLLITHNMYSQFRTGLHLVPITDNHISGRFLRYSTFGWGTPLLLLAASGGIQYHDKGGRFLDTASLERQNCWFLDNNAFVYGLLAPCCILIASTLYYLVRSGILARYIISIQADSRIREKMRRKRTLQILLFTKLCVLLSTVLVLSACSKLHRWPWAWASFHAAQGLQGILSAALVACDCRLLKVYTKSVRTRATKHVTTSSKSPNVAKSASMQLLTWEPLPDAV